LWIDDAPFDASRDRESSLKISVIIAAFNVERFVGRAIDSVRNQTIADWEIIVVDDASQDGTPDIAREYAGADPRISLIRQTDNRGPSAARNRAIEAARGEWIAILDADDSWRPERLEMLLLLAAKTGADLVADDLIVFDEGLGRETGHAMNPESEVTNLDIEALFAMRLGLMKPLIRRRLLLETGLRYDETLRSAEDIMLYAELMFRDARAVMTRDAYYVYTMRVGPVSRKRASGSRSTTSPDDLLKIADTLSERYAGQMTARLAEGLDRFRQMAESRRTASEITRLRHSGNPIHLLLFLLGNPRGAIRYVATSRTWARLLGRKPQKA
jgi:succinoglycan biosynthesis protein ExoO